jgi:hypothetical protein
MALTKVSNAMLNISPVSLTDFGAVGDGVTDDTAAWNAFYGVAGLKFIPPGNYNVSGTVYTYNDGCIVTDDFDSSSFSPSLDGISRSAIRLGKYYETGDVIRPQLQISSIYENVGSVGSTKTYNGGLYVEHEQNTGDAANDLYSHSIMGYALNNAAGNNDVIGVSGRVRKNNVVDGIGDSAGVWGSAYQYSDKDGGVMATESSIYQNITGTVAADRLSTKWSVCHHLNSDSTGSPATAALAIDSSGDNAGKYGFWNGIILDKNAFSHNGSGTGIAGTVGINCGSWDNTVYPEYGWKVGNATYHIYRGNALFSINTNRLDVESTAGGTEAAGLRINTTGTGPSYIDLVNNGTVKSSIFWDNVNSRLTLGSNFSDSVLLRTNGAGRLEIDSAGNIKGFTDNSYSCGTASNRWTEVYAATGTINTSDARNKQQIRTLSDSERAVAVRVKGLLRAFKFNDAVEEKGDAARIHFGVIAQEVADAFTAEGLDASNYALFCYDEWEEQQEQLDADGNVEAAYRPAGNRFGIRYEELLAFIISAL